MARGIVLSIPLGTPGRALLRFVGLQYRYSLQWHLFLRMVDEASPETQQLRRNGLQASEQLDQTGLQNLSSLFEDRNGQFVVGS